MRHVRLFISSPTDVDVERERAEYIAASLSTEFPNVVKFETVRWEVQRYYSAHTSTQGQIAEAADCDIVLAIFWKRLGTPPPVTFRRCMPDGSPYPSGTAYELLSAIEARNRPGAERPDIYVFKKTEDPRWTRGELYDAQNQLNRLDTFLEQLRRRNGGAIHPFEGTEDFAEQLKQLLTGWIERNLRRGEKLLPWPSEKGSPFRGLAVFNRKHADIFFGRSRRTMRAIDNLKEAASKGLPFLMIIGPSGSGKSSLMRAGLATRLTAPGVVPEVRHWRTAVMDSGWAEGPFHALARALFVSGSDDDDLGGFGAALPELKENYGELLTRILQGANEPAARLIVDTLDHASRGRRGTGVDRDVRDVRDVRDRTDLLLLVDQLEEIFAATVVEQDRSSFVQLLRALVTTGRIWVVATLRADFFDNLILDRPLFELKDKGADYELGPPGESELTEIVQKSAEAAGLVYGVDPESGQSLDELILDDAVGGDSLPLLEFTLDALYNERAFIDGQSYLTVAAYKRMGRLDGAINNAANRAIMGLSEAEKAVLPRLLTSLVVSKRDKDEVSADERWRTARLVPTSDAAPDEQARALVRALVDSRILLAFNLEYAAATGDRAAPQDVAASSPLAAPVAALRIAHERVLHSWQLARDIIDGHEEFIRIRDEVEDQRRKWLANNRTSDCLITSSYALHDAEVNLERFSALWSPEIREFINASLRRARHNQIRDRAVRIAIVTFGVLCLFAGVIAWYMYKEAQNNYDLALQTIDQFTNRSLTSLRDASGISKAAMGEVLRATDGTIDKLQSGHRTDRRLMETRASTLFQFAKTYQSVEQWDAASKAAAKALEIRQELLREEPNRTDRKQDVADSEEQVGDLARENGRLDDAWADFEQTLRSREELVRESPEDIGRAIRRAGILTRLGDLNMRFGRKRHQQSYFKEAQRRYQAAFDGISAMARRHPDNRDLQHELGWSYAKLGDVTMALGGGALPYFQNALCIRRLIVGYDQTNTKWARDLAFSLDRVGQLQLQSKRFDAARDTYREALAIRWTLYNQDSSYHLVSFDLSLNLTYLAKVYEGQSPPNHPLALAFAKAATHIFTALTHQSPSEKNQQALVNTEQLVAEISANCGGVECSDDYTQPFVESEEHAAEQEFWPPQIPAAVCWNQIMQTLSAGTTAPALRAAIKVGTANNR